jgi:hypothetical protein
MTLDTEREFVVGNLVVFVFAAFKAMLMSASHFNEIYILGQVVDTTNLV